MKRQMNGSIFILPENVDKSKTAGWHGSDYTV